ncbi:MAG: hypothetical protein U0640_00555 [Phycisphaerales bacterium]
MKRPKLLISFERLINREYWPTWAWYALLSPALLWLTIRHRTIFAWLACNPGIECGGGWVGESKWAILKSLGEGEHIARSIRIPADTDIEQRIAAVAAAARDLQFPLILKPDIGERGHAVKLARSLEEVRAYFHNVHSDVIAQAYHPGPKECGVLWARTLKRDNEQGPTGLIYSITAKEFPILECDGVRTLEEQILAHPRFRRQHKVFLTRFAKDAKTVFPKGHIVRLSVAGNHCQGTLFYDGDHLRSPELERVIDSIASRFGECVGNPNSLDFARFDIRYESDELLRQGKSFVIIEANGTSAESTNIYDPKRSLWWALRVLFGQWVILAKLGLWRTGRDTTHTQPTTISPKPSLATLQEIMRNANRLREQRGGSAIAD